MLKDNHGHHQTVEICCSRCKVRDMCTCMFIWLPSAEPCLPDDATLHSSKAESDSVFLLRPSALQLCHSNKSGGSIFLFSVTCRVRDYFIWKYLPLCECDRWETSDMRTYRHITVLTHWPTNLWPPAGSSVRSKLSWPHPNLIQGFPFRPNSDLRPPRCAGPYLMFIGSHHFIFISHLQALLHDGIMLPRP